MSGGHGRIQRLIIAAIEHEDTWYSLRDIAAKIAPADQVASVRRAARKLADEGVLDVELRPARKPYSLGSEWVADDTAPLGMREEDRRGFRVVKELQARRPGEFSAWTKRASLSELESAVSDRLAAIRAVSPGELAAAHAALLNVELTSPGEVREMISTLAELEAAMDIRQMLP